MKLNSLEKGRSVSNIEKYVSKHGKTNVDFCYFCRRMSPKPTFCTHTAAAKHLCTFCKSLPVEYTYDPKFKCTHN